jgi:hypothetical protein
MCDLSARLIAWLDHELPEEEAADVERHLPVCRECQSSVNAYEKVGEALDAYCEAVMASKVRRNQRGWVPAVLGAAAVTAAVLLIFPHARVEPPQMHSAATAPQPTLALETLPAPVAPIEIKRVRRRRAIAPAQTQDVNWPYAEAAIQIAIPAEAILPPGAIPEGVNFLADITIAADGSAEGLRLRPRLVGFQRRPSQ